MYWEINVPYPASRAVARDIVQTALQLGYDGIVWCQTVSPPYTAKDLVNKMTAVELETTDAKQPTAAPAATSTSTSAGAKEGKQLGAAMPVITNSLLFTPAPASQRALGHSTAFRQLFRVTIVLDDQSHVHTIQTASAALKSFDVVAVQPTTDKLFHQSCQLLEVDIITFDFSRKLPYYIKLQTAAMAIARGLFFEISFGSAIRDAAGSRRWVVSGALQLLRGAKSKNIVLTVQPMTPLQFRNPYDVVNLGVLLGLEQSSAKAAISSHIRSILLHAETRRTVKSVLTVSKQIIAPPQPAAAAAATANGFAPVTVMPALPIPTDSSVTATATTTAAAAGTSSAVSMDDDADGDGEDEGAAASKLTSAKAKPKKPLTAKQQKRQNKQQPHKQFS